MKIALIIIGLLLILLGAVWTLQGFNVLAGSAMSGHRRWVLVGGAIVIVGVFLEVLAARVRKK